MMVRQAHHRPVRVRFAPSPTGNLHMGSARTALFNWLYAQKHDGEFVLRIEDTNKERSKKEYEKAIINSLKWLGFNWDGDIFYQSKRLDIYEKYLRRLLDEHKAYYCFCSKEQLEADRQAMLAQGLAPKYIGRCANLSQEAVDKKIKSKEPSVIRFRTPAADIEFNDAVKGKIKIDSSLLGDIVIAKNLRSPLFIFSGTVDDYEMAISHIIRGEDHLPNTPKQILLQKVLGFDEPKYAHLPLILSPSRAKLSKRLMETSVDDYRRQGYLSDTIVNFLALLGWHPQDDQEVLSRDELIKKFELGRIQKGGAIFDIVKLEWLNSQYLQKTDVKSLARLLKDFIPKEWHQEKAKLIKAINVEKERIKKLTDFADLADFFFELLDYDKNLLFWPRAATIVATQKNGGDPAKTIANLKLVKEEINKISKRFNKITTEKAIMPLTEVWGRGELLWPLRVALSGKEASPGPFEIMEVLGQEETIKRIGIAIKKLE